MEKSKNIVEICVNDLKNGGQKKINPINKIPTEQTIKKV